MAADRNPPFHREDLGEATFWRRHIPGRGFMGVYKGESPSDFYGMLYTVAEDMGVLVGAVGGDGFAEAFAEVGFGDEAEV